MNVVAAELFVRGTLVADHPDVRKALHLCETGKVSWVRAAAVIKASKSN